MQPLKSSISNPIAGEARVPGDKSMSHRSLLIGALAIGETVIEGLLEGEDVLCTAAALRALGASRTKIALVGIAPAMLPRFLTYFFYRWETCVREATVLGILGMASLGWLIDEAQVSGYKYDEMVFFIGLGVVIVLLGDLISAIARGIVRRAS